MGVIMKKLFYTLCAGILLASSCISQPKASLETVAYSGMICGGLVLFLMGKDNDQATKRPVQKKKTIEEIGMATLCLAGLVCWLFNETQCTSQKIESLKTVVLAYKSNWITPEVIKQNPDITFIQVTQDNKAKIQKRYNITEIADLMLIKNGKLVYSLTGKSLYTLSLQSLINAYLRS